MKNESRRPNRLIESTSPYLQQHAFNPVDWFPWSTEALKKAKTENKLIFLSIGYASCHWCHVMERESFEDESVAAFLNEHFVPIKVDREERPDLDAVYMEAVQLMTGSGGWPLNIWLTPDLDPVFGGTYFPPEPNYRLPGFAMVLQRLLVIAKDDPEKLQRQGASMRNALQRDIMESLRVHPQEGISLEKAATHLANQMDKKFGGFGSAPKFPNTMALRFLLESASVYSNTNNVRLGHFSLKQLFLGGIYDQIGGGLARYSTDERWLVPHFEKMLYDQALLLSASVSLLKQQPDPSLAFRVQQTIDFLDREMMTASGEYASAIDADSEGVEGKFYVWTKQEIEHVLGNESLFETAVQYFGLTDHGNWEETTILEIIDRGLEAEAFENAELFQKLSDIRTALLAERTTRIRPITDTKNLLSWNALLLSSLCSFAKYSGAEKDRNRAVALAEALRKNHFDSGVWYRVFHQENRDVPAFLDDLSLTATAFLNVFEITGNLAWYNEAETICKSILDGFYDGDGGFFFVKKNADEVPFKTRDLFDNAVPGGFSCVLTALQLMNRHSGNVEFTKILSRALEITRGMATENPLSFGNLMQVLLAEESDKVEWVVIGPDAEHLARERRKTAPFNTIVLHSVEENPRHPLFDGKIRPDTSKNYVWECRNFTCGLPVELSVEGI